MRTSSALDVVLALSRHSEAALRRRCGTGIGWGWGYGCVRGQYMYGCVEIVYKLTIYGDIQCFSIR
jgi:hypothetical protein